jgi:hypothetical protein
VYFYSNLSHGRLAAVARSSSTAAVLKDSIRALIAGPTESERSAGFMTAVPPTTRVHDVELK